MNLLMALAVFLGQLPSVECPAGTTRRESPGSEETTSIDCFDDRGRLSGPSVERGSDGGLRGAWSSRFGKPQGRSRTWYADGTRKSDSDYDQGELDGLSLDWFPDGGLANAGRWSHGHGVDTWTFDEDGLPKQHFARAPRSAATIEEWYAHERFEYVAGLPHDDDFRLGNALRPCVRGSIREPVKVDADVRFELSVGPGGVTAMKVTPLLPLEPGLRRCFEEAVRTYHFTARGKVSFRLRLGKAVDDAPVDRAAIEAAFKK